MSRTARNIRSRPGAAATPTRLLLASALALVSLSTPRSGEARGPTDDRAERNADDLDGMYLMLGPVGTVSYIDAGWQGTFGGQLLGVRVRERSPLSSLGLALGGVHHTDSRGGRVWADALVGTHIAGVHAGLAIGATARLDGVAPPNWGAQATVWVFAGVIPYVRAGAVEEQGRFLELGVQIMLPALRL